MNKKLIATLLLSSLILTGCSNDKKYEDLERRVSNLEQRVGIVETSNNTQATQNNQTSNIEETTFSQYQGTYNYIIEDMSSDEIVNDCIKYFTTIPELEGKNIDEYYSLLGHDCIENTNYFPSSTFTNNSNPEVDCIIYIGGNYLYSQMDNTIGKNDYGNISIRMFIKDFNKAQDIYDKIATYIKEKNYVKEIQDDRDGTSWRLIGYIPTSESGMMSGDDICYMEKSNLGYFISINYYITKW